MSLLKPYLRACWKMLAAALVCATVAQVLALIEPLLVRYIIDVYAVRFRELTSRQFASGAGRLLALGLAIAIVSRAAKGVQEYLVHRASRGLGNRLYNDGIAMVLELPYDYLDDQRSGETLSKLQKARIDVERLIGLSINTLFAVVIAVAFVTIYAARVHWSIAPAYLIAVPLLALISSMLGRKIKGIQRTLAVRTSALAGSTTESLRNVELVKSLGLVKQEIARLDGTAKQILAIEQRERRYVSALNLVHTSVISVFRSSLLFLMLYLVFTLEMTVGQFFSLFMYSFFMSAPLQELGNVFQVYRETAVSMQEYSSLLAARVTRPAAGREPVTDLVSLSFEGVSYRHRTASKPALRDITFQVSRGETIAFVGPSGAGKTTLVKLLVGLYQPQSGTVYYNGRPADNVDIEGLRAQIGFVTQDTQLFAGSLLDNLLFVNPGATIAECSAVVRQASLEPLLARCEHGLHTVIGEAGLKISGGERQRLSLARALLRNPRLLVLDEATSSLDSLTETEINQTLRALAGSRGTVTVLIAHRLSTVLHADRIYVLERGRIVEQGSHESLLAGRGLYAAMWRQQAGDNIASYAQREA